MIFSPYVSMELPVFCKIIFDNLNTIDNVQSINISFKRVGYQKKLIAEDLRISVFKDNRIIIALAKDREELHPDLKSLTVHEPTILETPMNNKPKAITIDKDSKTITVYYYVKANVIDLLSP